MPRGYPNSGERLARDTEPTAAEIAAIEAEKAKIRAETGLDRRKTRLRAYHGRPSSPKRPQKPGN